MRGVTIVRAGVVAGAVFLVACGALLGDFNTGTAGQTAVRWTAARVTPGSTSTPAQWMAARATLAVRAFALQRCV